MTKPVLVIMAAGMGSRYGGLKQIDPIDDQGHIIIDYSIYDAKKAGFDQVIFVIRREHEQIFREAIGDRIARTMKVRYAFQSLEDLPEGYAVPEGRTKPWGTGHAVLAARKYIHGPFAVINADDYYGSEAFSLIYDALAHSGAGDVAHAGAGDVTHAGADAGAHSGAGDVTHPGADAGAHAGAGDVTHPGAHSGADAETYTMVGYLLKNTLTDNGYVSRGVCTLTEDRKLDTITERTKIIRKGRDAAFSEDEGRTWTDIAGDTVVSMNMWGFPESFMHHLKEEFPDFLSRTLKKNPLKGEFFLPFVVNDLMNERKAEVNVLTTHDVWHGVTYQEDKKEVAAAMKALRKKGQYPDRF